MRHARLGFLPLFYFLLCSSSLVFLLKFYLGFVGEARKELGRIIIRRKKDTKRFRGIFERQLRSHGEEGGRLIESGIRAEQSLSKNRIFNYKRHRHVNFIFACTIACTRLLPRSLVIAIENLVSGSHCLAERMHISHVRYPPRAARRRVAVEAC